MALFLWIVSVVYLASVWLGFAFAVANGDNPVFAVLISGALSTFGVVLYAFAKVVDDVREIRADTKQARFDLEAMRRSYERPELEYMKALIEEHHSGMADHKSRLNAMFRMAEIKGIEIRKLKERWERQTGGQ